VQIKDRIRGYLPVVIDIETKWTFELGSIARCH
jgi:hypothetical protein